MNREEFIIFIESLGFEKYNKHYIPMPKVVFTYKKYILDVYNNSYHFYNGYKWCDIYFFTDITPLEKIIRDNKLKQLLG